MCQARPSTINCLGTKTAKRAVDESGLGRHTMQSTGTGYGCTQGIVCPIICCAMIRTEYGDLSRSTVHAEVTVQVPRIRVRVRVTNTVLCRPLCVDPATRTLEPGTVGYDSPLRRIFPIQYTTVISYAVQSTCNNCNGWGEHILLQLAQLCS